MMSFTTRQCAVLRELLVADDSLTAPEIASRLGVSPRMVRYDLRIVKGWLAQRGVRLIQKPNYGIRAMAPQELKAKLRRELDAISNRGLVFSPAERLRAIVLALLVSRGPLLAKELAHRLGVSPATVLADMRGVEKWLAQHGLQLLSRPRVGFYLTGRELSWRQAAVEGLMAAVEGHLLLGICTGSEIDLPPCSAVGALQVIGLEVLSMLELAFARQLVQSIEDKLQRQFTDPSRISLVLGLAMMVYRLRQDRCLDLDHQLVAALRAYPEYSLAETVTQAVQARYGLAVPSEEVAYVTMLLLGAGTRYTLADSLVSKQDEDIDPGILQTVRRMLAQASIYLQPCLEVDPILLRSLSLHTRTVLNRLRFGLPIHNPLLEDIRAQYPYVFQVAERASAILASVAGAPISQDEVAYIAMHLVAAMERLRNRPRARPRVLVVCGEATATAWLLVSRLQAELPEVEVVEVASADAISSQYLQAREVTAIISTVPIAAPGVPVTVVNPLLPAQDVAAIRTMLELDGRPWPAAARVQEPADCALSDLLTEETIALRAVTGSWQEVVHLSGSLLVAVGAVERRYVEAMKGLIERYGPYVVITPGVALLHARPGDGVKRTRMSLVTLQPPVPFGHARHDPVEVAVGLGTLDNVSHLSALKQLVQLLTNPTTLRLLKQARRTEEVCALIKQASATSV
ncbi:MAG: BglG family transcription antiterminator [Anaerolineae bacterium]